MQNKTIANYSGKRTLPFSISPYIWDGLSSDIQRLLWEGWSLKLQLDELAYGQQHNETVDEAGPTGLIKPILPLTPNQSRKRQQKIDGEAARLQAAKRAAAEKIVRLQQNLADEGETAGA